eukprot:2442130-Amphidinium_carterae.1
MRKTVVTYDVHEKWLRFAGAVQHRVIRVRGHRMSVAYYCPSGVHVLKRQDWLSLSRHGFPVHEFWSYRKPLADQ